ncbi:MAG TPA: VOC family protein [Solirubrobacterales bacterium]|nr:VOC family protein [Solirubrobacterales bacterium]
MEPKVTVLTLGVRDLERSRRFYVEGLGWKPTLEVEGEVIFIQVAGGQVLALWEVTELAREAGNIGHSAKAPPIAIGHNVDSPEEVARVIQQAVAAGASLVSPATATSWGGTNGYFADPDGFRWEVAHNSGFRVTADGRVHMGPVDP